MNQLKQTTLAYQFYQKYILNPEKVKLFQNYGFNQAGRVSYWDWELFAAILLGDKRSPETHTDLLRYEIKSSINGSSYEYQYCKCSGMEKLELESIVDHVFY